MLFFLVLPERSRVLSGIELITDQQNSHSYEIKIQPDDLLIDCVSAEDQEVAMPFNLQSVMCSKP
jgi:polysaccharide export outer membrane protein